MNGEVLINLLKRIFNLLKWTYNLLNDHICSQDYEIQVAWESWDFSRGFALLYKKNKKQKTFAFHINFKNVREK